MHNMLNLKENISAARDLSAWAKFFQEFSVAQGSAPDFSAREPFSQKFAAEHRPKVTRLTVDSAEAETFLRLFGTEYKALQSGGWMVDIWEVCGLGKDEMRNSAVLAWFLDCHGSHGQSRNFLDLLMAALPESRPVGFPDSQDITPFYRTKVESHYDDAELNKPGRQSRRVDIEINGADFLLFIEVKIEASETPNQLRSYLEVLSASRRRATGLIFLTPDGRPPLDEDTRTQVVSLSWESLARSFRKAEILKNFSLANSFVATLIRQFCDHMEYIRRR